MGDFVIGDREKLRLDLLEPIFTVFIGAKHPVQIEIGLNARLLHDIEPHLYLKYPGSITH